MASLPFDRILSTTFFMSRGATNCPFFTFTGLPVAAAARIRSVWRQRNAGIWITSRTSAAGSTSLTWWTSDSTGIFKASRTLRRMRLPRPRAELGMELAGDEVRVLGDLDDLDQLLLGPDPGDAQARLLQAREIVVVHLVAVAMSLLDDPLSVQARGQAALAQHDRV